MSLSYYAFHRTFRTDEGWPMESHLTAKARGFYCQDDAPARGRVRSPQPVRTGTSSGRSATRPSPDVMPRRRRVTQGVM